MHDRRRRHPSRAPFAIALAIGCARFGYDTVTIQEETDAGVDPSMPSIGGGGSTGGSAGVAGSSSPSMGGSGASCATECENAHGTASCETGSCVVTCEPGWADCDANPIGGCETDLSTSVEHCGFCGNDCSAASGAAFCNAGACDAVCDLGGTFGLKLSAVGSWPDTSTQVAGSGAFTFWLKAESTQTGSSMNVDVTDCGRVFPGFQSASVSDRILFGVPDALFDADQLPSSPAVVTLSSTSPGASIAWPLTGTQMGIDLANPATDAWPSAASQIAGGQRIDMEGDGQPGVTGIYADGGGFIHPRTSSASTFNRADRAYFAARLAFSLGGTLESCSTASGGATVSKVERRIFGCHRASSAQNCDSNEGNFLDAAAINYSMGSASYALQRVANGAGCAAIRAALP